MQSSSSSLPIIALQFQPCLGKPLANSRAIIDQITGFTTQTANKQPLFLLPALALTGPVVFDQLFYKQIFLDIEKAKAELAASLPTASLLVSYPKKINGQIFSALGWLHLGKWQAEYLQQEISLNPSLQAKRYFSPAPAKLEIIEINSIKLGLLLDEEAFNPALAQAYAQAGAQLLLVAAANPWQIDQHKQRLAAVQASCQASGLPLVFVNTLGGYAESVFDGASFALTDTGKVVALAPAFEPAHLTLDFSHQELSCNQPLANPPEDLAYLYQALVFGLKTYVDSCGFKGVILGMSGGLDSALVAALAVDALGADKVTGIMLPYHYTAEISRNDAAEQAELMGIRFSELPIEPIVSSLKASLADLLISPAAGVQDTTEQNLQARSRGLLLMALSNNQGLLLLTTSNKSELAVGYTTLYGDMAGGFNPIKDVYKTQVYALANWRNQQGRIIPERVITRPPTAELAPNQSDSDNLPDYPLLDKLLHQLLEDYLTPAEIIAQGADAELVERVSRLVNLNEFKRRQSAPGIQLSKHSLGSNRNWPLV